MYKNWYKLGISQLYLGSCSFCDDPYFMTKVETWTVDRPVNWELSSPRHIHHETLSCGRGPIPLNHLLLHPTITCERDIHLNSCTCGKDRCSPTQWKYSTHFCSRAMVSDLEEPTLFPAALSCKDHPVQADDHSLTTPTEPWTSKSGDIMTTTNRIRDRAWFCWKFVLV